MFFSVNLGWLPSTGRGDVATYFGITSSIFTLDGLSHLFLPAFNLALFKLSSVIRLARAGTREVILQDYIKFARAKGLGEGRIIRVHLLKNIMIPIVTVIGLEFGSLIAFSTVTETVFAWPGMGKLIIDCDLQFGPANCRCLSDDYRFDLCHFESDRGYYVFIPRSAGSH